MDTKNLFSEENLKTVQNALTEGATMREMKGISDEEMEAVYSIGVNAYRTGNYEDAEKVFKFLVLFDHRSSRYWTAMGSLLQVQRKFAEALEAYKMASLLDLENPKPMYYAAECYMALGSKDEALMALDGLAQYVKPDTEKGRDYLARGAQLRAKLVA